MIRSMTGYGRGTAAGVATGISVEMRSVNNRFLDVQVKLPRNLASIESRVRKAVQERFSRGRIDVFISRSGNEANPFRLGLDHGLAEQYIGILKELKARYALSGDVDLSLASTLPDIITREEVSEDADALWGLVESGIEQAAAALRTMRENEGAALARDIAERLASIEIMTRAVGLRVPMTVEQARKRMTESLERILKEQPDPLRVAQEIAILAERTDVTEELTRLGSHLSQLRAMLSSAGQEPVGRKLDFLIQEMGREVNTIASKALDAEISLQVVQIKAELEKIREQAQNIE
jgi:uncharacterized protein (TIGR00255 family)